MLSITTYLAPLAGTFIREEIRVGSSNYQQIFEGGKFHHPASGITLFIRDISSNGELLDVFISDRRDDGYTYDYSAANAYLFASENKAALVMTNGMTQIYDTKSKLLSLTGFGEFTYDLSEAFEKNNERQVRLSQLPTLLLWNDPNAAMKATDKTLAQVLENFHRRAQNALLCLVATLIGFATLYAADFSRYGSGRFIAFAIFLLVNVKIVESAVIDITRSNSNGWPLVYSPTLIGLSMCIFMLKFSEHKWKLRSKKN